MKSSQSVIFSMAVSDLKLRQGRAEVENHFVVGINTWVICKIIHFGYHTAWH